MYRHASNEAPKARGLSALPTLQQAADVPPATTLAGVISRRLPALPPPASCSQFGPGAFTRATRVLAAAVQCGGGLTSGPSCPPCSAGNTEHLSML